MDERLESRIARVQASGQVPLAVLDVDLTLIDNAPRTRAIFSDWLHSVRDRWPRAGDKAIEALTMPIVFGVNDNLSTLGVTDPDLRRDALAYWLEAFFDSTYCRRDMAMPRAVESVEALRARGVTIAYLTARYARMAEGTVASFRQLGFPVNVPGTVLMLKEDPNVADRVYKERALSGLRQLGNAVLCADNGPSHANTMHAAFPHALTVHVDTRHSAGAPELTAGVVQVPQLAEVVLGTASATEP